VVAKTPATQNSLVQQLQERSVKRIYRAVADGIVPFDGKIDTLIGRDPHNRLKMAVVGFGGKKAVTHIKVLERYQSHSYIECALETGRTHQIRVHMREAKHPLAADPVYGNPRHPCSDAVKEAVHQLARQALHAYRLSFVHPESGETVQFEAPLPEDIHHLLSVLRWECGMDSALSHALPPAEPGAAPAAAGSSGCAAGTCCRCGQGPSWWHAASSVGPAGRACTGRERRWWWPQQARQVREAFVVLAG